MSHMMRLLSLTMIFLGLSACSQESDNTVSITSTMPPATHTIQPNTTTPTIRPQSTIIVTEEPKPTTDPALFPFSERGPYWTGRKVITLFDASRDGREITLTIWYPAVKQADGEGKFITLDATPDMSNAPYPLILTGFDTGTYLYKSHLASHGFVMAIVSSSGLFESWDYGVIDKPLDLSLIHI